MSCEEFIVNPENELPNVYRTTLRKSGLLAKILEVLAKYPNQKIISLTFKNKEVTTKAYNNLKKSVYTRKNLGFNIYWRTNKIFLVRTKEAKKDE